MAEPKGVDLMGVLGWIVAVVLVALMLPVLAFLYLDVLEKKADVKAITPLHYQPKKDGDLPKRPVSLLAHL